MRDVAAVGPALEMTDDPVIVVALLLSTDGASLQPIGSFAPANLSGLRLSLPGPLIIPGQPVPAPRAYTFRRLADAPDFLDDEIAVHAYERIDP